MPTERLQKVLAAAGVASRRGSEALVAAGRVTVDGRVATPGQAVDPAVARIEVDGRAVAPLGPVSPVHLLLHKPTGVTSTVRDRHATRTVLDLVPRVLIPEAGRLYPVGRLDQDSDGLLILTNDGPWADRVLHPRYGVEREYAVGLGEALDREQVRALEEGIALDEGLAVLFHLREATAPETRRLVELLAPVPRPSPGTGRPCARGGSGRSGGCSRRSGCPSRGWYACASVPSASNACRAARSGPCRRRRSAAWVRGTWPVARRPGRTVALGAAAVHRYPEVMTANAGERRLVVALDGPASSGKSSVGAAAALELGYRFIDTGLLYRALTWLSRARRIAPDDAGALAAMISEVRLAPDTQNRLDRVLVDGRDVTDDVRTADVDRHVSDVAKVPEVRAAFLPVQRALAADGGIIVAGRDIGTVVLPDADLKIFLDASVEERARRRAEERGLEPGGHEARWILAELRRRDQIDRNRPVAPLRPAEDARHIRTDGNSFEQTVAAVVAMISEAAAIRLGAAMPVDR